VNVKKVWLSSLISFALATFLIGSPLQVRALPPSTTTTLAVSSGGTAVTTVTAGSVVTLTAAVKTGSNAVTTGQVNFCDATSVYCTDIHLLGTAQLTSAGTAALKLVPGIGPHQYKAVFLPQTGFQGSTSGNSLLSVTGKAVTLTVISQSGSVDNYSLTATVTGHGVSAPTGQVSFLDASYANAPLASANLISSNLGLHFVNPQTPATGNQPDGIAVGDFNGDGKPDLAIANYTDNTVTILLGNGDGTFTASATSPATGINPIALVAGDFNGDGKADLAVVNNGDNTMTVLLGNGDGTFTPAGAAVSTGINPLSVAAGDFNGDGIADLAVANYSDNTLMVFLGNGDGTFTATTTNSPTINGPSFVAVGDFNNDGIADLAVTNYNNDTLTILLGQGDGTFVATSANPATGNSPNAAVVADFAGNGKADLAVVNSGDNTVSILLGNGDGTFKPETIIPTGSLPYSIGAGDLNGDGKVDLVVTNDSDNTLTVLLGKGDGTFTSSATNPATGQSPWPIAVADLNGDGIADIAAGNFTDSTVTVFLSSEQEATAAASGISVTGIGPHHVYASYAGDASFGASASGATDIYASTPAPQFNPAPGTYTTIQSVSINALAGSIIYYTTDGSVPTSASNLYSGPIQVAANETITAIAMATGYGSSAPVSAAYILNLPAAAAPVLSVSSGVFPSSQTVSITDATPGATIYYTTDGTVPTVASTVYGGPITVASSETLTATAIALGYSMSPPASAQYTIVAGSAPFIYNFAGSGTAGYRGDGGRALDAAINNPFGPAFDKAGNLYFADSINNRVRKVAAGTGIITTVAGIGTSGYSGDGAAATTAQLNGPSSVAFDSKGNLYIADTGNYAVRKVDVQTGKISSYAGTGTPGYSGDGQAASAALLSNVKGLAVDGADNLYIADSGNNSIRMVTAQTLVISTVTGSGTAGYSGDGAAAINALLSAPSGVSLDQAGNLYIADTNNEAIRKVAASNKVITTVAGDSTGIAGNTGDGGPATSAKLNAPTTVAVDSAGNLYIADSQNSIIRKVSSSDLKISTFAGDQSVCNPVSGDGGLAIAAGFCYPTGVTLDGNGNVYIADSYGQRIREVTIPVLPMPAGVAPPVLTVAAGTYPDPQTVTISSATPGASIYITMDGSTPTALSSGYDGPINVTGNVTIQALSIAPGLLPSAPVTAQYTITSPPVSVISTIAGDGVNGTNGIGGLAVNAELGYLQGLAQDSKGNLYLSDGVNNEVLTISAQTGDIAIVAGNGTSGYSGDGALAMNAQLNSPSGVAVDSAGNLYIADASNCVIRLVTASTKKISTYAGNSQCGYTGDSAAATAAELNYPTGVALDSAGNLYIADSGNAVIRMVTSGTGVISTVAGNGQFVDSGDNGAATSAAIQDPIALALDGSGNLFVAEQNGRIRRVDAKTEIITTVAGNGDLGYSGDNGLATDAEISTPSIALDQAGNLYITSQPGAVRMVSAGSNVITPVAGTGFPGYSGDGGAATVAELNGPAGVVVDGAGNLYIADANNYRIRKVTFPAAAATPGFSLAPGNYVGTRQVTITDSTAGAVIYYTTDGSEPTTYSAVYSGAISVSASETLSAMAVAPGLVYSPVATASYTIVPQTVPVITWAAPAAITYGTALSSAQLDATSTVQGTFAYTPAAGTVLTAGTQTLSVTFTPTDQVDYTTASSTVQITVNQATPTISWATPAGITYGTALSAAQLNATSATQGTFAYTPALGVVLGAGTQTLSVTFTPTDGTDYTTATATVQLAVGKATPSISWATPAGITYGTALSATQLNATSATQGTFAYTPALGVVPGAGTQTLSVTFTPTDGTDYTTATATVQLAVSKATPTISWATPAGITYGTALSATQLNATSATQGTFAYTPALGVVLGAGTQTLSVTFTPTDGTDYTTATTTVQLAVSKATPTISWATPAGITYGTALSAAQLNASSATQGTFAYTPALGVVPGAGTQTLSVTFTPTDGTDYTTATATVQLAVSKATPSITWATPAGITYGTALSAAQLNATSATQGTFAYTPALGVVPGAGTQTLSVTFTPTDGTDYTTATATVQLTVSKATPTISWATPAGITYGTALSAAQLNATSATQGTFAYTPAAGTMLAVGTQTLSVTFTPTDGTDYTTATATVQLTVSKATPAITVTPASASINTVQTDQVTVIVSGGTGSQIPTGTITLSSGSYSAQQTLASGSTTFTVPAGALALGSDTLTATYAPDVTGAIDYNAASQSASVSVVPAIGTSTSTVTVSPSAATITDLSTLTVNVTVAAPTGQATPTGSVILSSGSYSAQVAITSGTAKFTVPSGALSSGADTLLATYSGDPTYNVETGTSTVTVLPFVVSGGTLPAIVPGAQGTVNLPLSAGSTYSGTVDLTCTLTTSPAGASSLPTCTLAPPTVTLTAGGSGTSVFTVTTKAASSTAMAKPVGIGHWGFDGGAVLAGVLMLGIASKRRRLISLLAILIIAVAGGAMGCGGSSATSGTAPSTPATSAGTYVFTITGTDSANSKLTTSTTVTITVQ